ncbi:methylmalonyl Co-A mutase-associated GTPase MeaB [Jeotgalibacillus haloalkalitolerans]|uniref:Methylmalonyl Co-A mutase-associated GTPase MeaB n=1 Tax=Jeotgalibacillus haloalkalitolerans TaxID=3104292 RepID=A0ABU5KLF0_9BACL|nr:methylmalonyl Co-A mutase-associated GTPase MeaB [Jeotgalibacillus sp. HH7-29]MDZ5712100.1 methylmalonyl Co-A mutase-associated GTPase MeaB [Jeotgalibacillus sp. HH7-29]
MNNPNKKRVFKKKVQEQIHIPELAEKIISGNRGYLSKGITLIESSAAHHREKANELMQELLTYTGNSIRLGITGVPGAGKSTWIEAFGKTAVSKGYKIAVLAVDPSSTLSGGSILGDKTRMEFLAHHPDVFIRPSPSSGTLGGVARMTRETILLCEAAGYDLILVETVGVGQSEGIVRGMTDFFLLLSLTGAGDELQGMKKGIMELVDAIVINKADGSNKDQAIQTMHDYNQILRFLTPATKDWKPRAYTCSALYNEGIEEIWDVINHFIDETKKNGEFDKRRSRQAVDWMNQLVQIRLNETFFDREKKILMKNLEKQVKQNEISATEAVDLLFKSNV